MYLESSVIAWCDQILEYMRYEREIEERKEREKGERKVWGSVTYFFLCFRFFIFNL